MVNIAWAILYFKDCRLIILEYLTICIAIVVILYGGCSQRILTLINYRKLIQKVPF